VAREHRRAPAESARRPPRLDVPYGRFGSGIAAEVGLLGTLGTGSAPTRSISWAHWEALMALVVTSGAGAVRPAPAECAAVAAAAGLIPGVAAAGGRNSRWMRFQSDADACVLAAPEKRIRLEIACGTNLVGKLSNVRIVSSVIDSLPWWPATVVPLMAEMSSSSLV
jgi:hypothetical protein